MKNKISINISDKQLNHDIFQKTEVINSIVSLKTSKKEFSSDGGNKLPVIFIITTYPPRECGIATYSQDLVKALQIKFGHSFSFSVCALETGDNTNYLYPDEVQNKINTSIASEYDKLTAKINFDESIKTVFVQHEFGLYKQQEDAFIEFLHSVSKPVIVVFHSVLSNPDDQLKLKVERIVSASHAIVVMTNNSAEVLKKDYHVPALKISVIPHGIHLVTFSDKESLKVKYGLQNRKVLATFGLLNSGKGFETSIEALPAIIKLYPETVFLILGKTHPEVQKTEGEKYREFLEQMVTEAGLADHVIFVNKYLPLPALLEYLQLTDIYLFTANDPKQAVSGTFVYAMSCACPIISTPIPHAKELLTPDTGIIIDFHDSQQLAESVISLFSDEALMNRMSLNTLQKTVSTAWENSAVKHALLFREITGDKAPLRYSLPEINLSHIQKLTTSTGIIQFSKINNPDPESGYTLDDNSRALIAICMLYKLTGDEQLSGYIATYLQFMEYCQQPAGNFLNYVDKDNKFTPQNDEVNLADSNGRSIWALGYVISLSGILPTEIIRKAEILMYKSLAQLETIQFARAMSFTIKGLYYYLKAKNSPVSLALVRLFAERLARMYAEESSADWQWYESSITYANSIMPEAMLFSWLLTGNTVYKDIAFSSFDFLLSKIIHKNRIEAVSNKSWLHKGKEAGQFGEQPINVANTIMTLSSFYDVYGSRIHRTKMELAFSWFLGNNRLNRIVYNPRTGGCYDGLEEHYVNLNQGSESAVCYLMARLTVQKYQKPGNSLKVVYGDVSG